VNVELSRGDFLRAGGAALAASLAGCADLASPAASDDPSAPAATLGVTYVGEADGSAAVDGRARVVSVRPSGGAEKRPVVMVPGLGLSPYVYLATPDGRPGWAEQFVDAGHPVHLFDPPRNVTAGGLTPDGFGAEPPALSRWSLERAWPTWGFGPEAGEAYPEVRYPVDHVDQLVASFPAYVSGGGGPGGGTRGGTGDGSGGGRFASDRETAALRALLDRVGPATLLVHSAGGASGVAVARAAPALVERVVAVEPVGCPTDETAVAEMGDEAPFMAVYGDYVAERGQTGRKEACATTARLASEWAEASRLLSLPDEGVRGNTHLLMQDDNNDRIADRILSWIA
jgi:pimeloyl-ACP methyl ester carboxylesterase